MLTGLIVLLIVGAIAGWVAGKLMRGGGFGVVGNIALGCVGALVGGHVLGWFGIHTYGFVGQLVTAIVGAVLILFVVGLLKK